MKIYAINLFQTRQQKINNQKSYNNNTNPIFSTTPIPSNLSMVYFTGLIPRANRLNKSDYLISGYINEISKARKFHGDRAVVDLSMGNPDLTPPEKAKQILKEKVND